MNFVCTITEDWKQHVFNCTLFFCITPQKQKYAISRNFLRQNAYVYTCTCMYVCITFHAKMQACGAGFECLLDVCYTCIPCAPGTYKTFRGDQKCLPCPPSTYNAKVGSFTECSLCPEGAITIGAGKASAEDCM